MHQRVIGALKVNYRRIRTLVRTHVDRLIWRFGELHPDPVFVLGVQKSGTTVIAALLAARMRVEPTLDIFYRLRDFSIEDRVFSGKEKFPEFISRHRRFFRNGVIKDPSFSFFASDLKEVFPTADFLFVVRDPRDNIRSILNRLKVPGTETSIESEVVRKALLSNPGWRSIVEGRNPPTRGGSIVETLALRWRMAARILLDNQDNLLRLRYEDFCEAKVESIIAAAEALGRDKGGDIAAMVDVQFQPKGDNSATWLEFFGRENLDQILEVCEEEMKLLGYPLQTSTSRSGGSHQGLE